MPSSNGSMPTFDGFSSPNYTQVPDELFDVLMPQLGDAELRVLLYIIRRTFGFKRDSDNISLKQMVDGIRTSDGRILDSGTGLSKASVARALVRLKERGIILAVRNRSTERGDEATTYWLCFKGEQEILARVSPVRHGSLSQQRDTPVSQQRDTQETVVQETDESLSKFERSHDEQISDDEDSRQQASPLPEGPEPSSDALELAQRPDMPLPTVSRLSGPQNEPEAALPERSVSQEFMAARDTIRSTLAERMSMSGEGRRRFRQPESPATLPQPPAVSADPMPISADPMPISADPAIPRRRGRPITGTSDERDLVYAYLDDFNRELLHDDAPISSLVTQTINIFRSGNIPQERWPDYLYQARTAVKEHAGAITKESRSNGSYKNRGPYYFAVLRNLVAPGAGQQSQPPGHIPSSIGQ